jgi:hypothetical protein
MQPGTKRKDALLGNTRVAVSPSNNRNSSSGSSGGSKARDVYTSMVAR